MEHIWFGKEVYLNLIRVMSKPRRIYSIDVFRGMTIALMILVNTPGSWAHVYSPLRHAKWHGCTLTDLVFPFFLFIVGASIRFAFVKWHYFPSIDFYKHVFWRTLSIFLIGLLLNAYPFIRQDWDYSSFRVMGVLQRIAIAYGLSSIIIIHFNFKQIMQIIFGILLSYWALLFFGAGNDPYSISENIIRKFDIIVIGKSHLYRGFQDQFGNSIAFDPEGILSTIPSVASVLLGYLLGGMIHTTKNYSDCAKRMSVFGIIILLVGFFWGFYFPINKALWTSSYVLFTAGIGALILAFLTFIIDNKQIKKPFWVFEIFGKNSIFVFILSGLWVKTIINLKLTMNNNQVSSYNYLYETVFVPIFGNLNGSLFFAMAHVIIFWIILYWMHKKDIEVKL